MGNGDSQKANNLFNRIEKEHAIPYEWKLKTIKSINKKENLDQNHTELT